MNELNDFYNDGFGWICRHCERDLRPERGDEQQFSRSFREGEAEDKVPSMANKTLAKWTDQTRRYLTCPRCGITEKVDIS